jgi:hypothetical protein
MAITRVASQIATASAIGYNVSLSSPNNVTSGNLVVVEIWTQWGDGSGYITAAQLTKTGGTATIDTIVLDVQRKYSGNPVLNCGIYSFKVTGTGSLTLQWAQGEDGFGHESLAINEYAGADVTATRLQASNTAEGSSTAIDSGNASSSGEGLFVGVCASRMYSGISLTEDAAFTLIGKNVNVDFVGGAEDRIVSSTTTDSASWTGGQTEAWCAAVAIYKGGAVVAAARVPRHGFVNFQNPGVF